MSRQTLSQARSDDGMGVVEVIVASFVLFFALTALLGLVGMTTTMSVNARQRTAMTNAISSYIEYVHSLPYESVALSTVEASGAVEPVVVRTDGPFTITLTNAVATGLNQTKEVSIAAECTADNRPAIRTSAFVAVRPSGDSTNDFGQPHSGGPTIAFGGLTPAENSIVYGSTVHGGASLYVDASVVATGGTITAVEFRVGDQRLRDGATTAAGEAYWTPGAISASPSIRWDTRQVEGTTSVPAVMDGWRIVRILATDDLGRQTFRDRRFLVDNYAPSDPGTPLCNPRTNVTTLITWPKSMDGTDPAYRYELRAYKERIDMGWDEVGAYSLTQPAHTLTTQTLSRYWVKVKAISPRPTFPLTSAFVGGAPFVSKPLLSGESSCTILGSASSRTSTVYVKLYFPTLSFSAGDVRYDLYRGTDPSTLALYRSLTPATSFSEYITEGIGNKSVTPYYYQLRITYTPLGWLGGTSQTVVSDIAGPTATQPGSIQLVQTW